MLHERALFYQPLTTGRLASDLGKSRTLIELIAALSFFIQHPLPYLFTATILSRDCRSFPLATLRVLLSGGNPFSLKCLGRALEAEASH
jgi:hypothetical protein